MGEKRRRVEAPSEPSGAARKLKRVLAGCISPRAMRDGRVGAAVAPGGRRRRARAQRRLGRAGPLQSDGLEATGVWDGGDGRRCAPLASGPPPSSPNVV